MTQTPFQNILDKYRKISFSEKDKGTRFERLMQAYLLSDPMYANKFKRLKLSDITKELKVTQKIASLESGEIQRLYYITLEVESARKIEKFLGLKFNKLFEVFSNQFIPLLMAEILK